MWTITPVVVDHPEAVAALRDYIVDIAARYYGRPATDEEVDRALADEPSTHLVPPTGVFLLATEGDEVTGCVGVHLLSERTAELNRLYVYPAARGRRGGAQLLRAAEQAARDLGAEVLRLNTRNDLVEARGLYAAHGYREIEHYVEGPYVDHCFEKILH
jgi:GNAT superfamily N-acetyltransferase